MTRKKTKTAGNQAPEYIVAIGASAGGLKALRELFESLPEDTGMAFVVLLHSDPHTPSQLPEVLGRRSTMPVTAAEEGLFLAADHVYTAPSERDLILENGCARLVSRMMTHRVHLPIDTLFCSLAQDAGERAIGVVLSGAGSDGTAGLRDIQGRGGLTFAQDEQSAEQTAMPKSAADAGVVDQILSPAEIASALARLARVRAKAKAGRSLAIEKSNVETITRLLRDSFSVDFAEYKQTTVLRRIYKRCLASKAGSLEEYRHLVESSPEECEALYRDILINVTSFFRDPETFEALRRQILPRICEGRPPGEPESEPIRIWVPGCASGEEVYSLAMTLAEFAQEQNRTFDVQIFGTDISEPSLEKARNGRYPFSVASQLSAERLKMFFDRCATGYQVKKHLRDWCVFARHNVVADPPLSRMDIISCRNLLIYFGAALQERMVPIFHYALKTANGFLLLGKSELVDIGSDFFVPFDKLHRFYLKKRIAARVPFRPVPGHRIPIRIDSLRPAPGMPPVKDPELEVQKETDRFILTYLSPALVVVTENSDIVQFRGNTAPYLSPSGRASLNLFKMLHPDLLQPVQSGLETARKGRGSAVKCTRLRHSTAGETHYVDVRILPLRGASLRDRYFLIEFQESLVPAAGERVEGATAGIQHLPDTDEVRRLSEDLEGMRRHLQSVIDEREIGFEELQAANEEVTSSNEELQTINQELETAKEELESSNEELTSLNEQLRLSMDELRKSEEHFRALVASVRDYAIFMLDPTGHVLSWNEGAQRIKGYTREEIVGKHFGTFYPEEVRRSGKLEQELATAISAGRFEEEGIRLRKDGSAFWANVVITPIYNEHGVLSGFAKVTRDITERRALEQSVRQSEQRFRLLVSAVRDYAIFMLDPLGYVLSWNEGAQRILGYKADEIVGQHFSRFLPKEEEARGQSELELNFAKGNDSYTEEGWRMRKEGTRFWASVALTAMRDDAGRLIGFSKVVRDLSEKREAEERLRQSEERYRLILTTAYDAFIAIDELGKITEWNPQAEKTFGWRRDEVIGQSLSDVLIPPRDRIAYLKGHANFLRTGESPALRKRLEQIALHKDGHEFPVELTVTPIRIGHEWLFCSFVHDISERKRAEKALQESEMKVRSLARFPEERPAPVVRMSPRGDVLYGNPASQPLLEYWRQDAEALQAVKRVVEEVCAEGLAREVESAVPSGIIYSLSYIPVESEHYVNIYGTDITCLKEIEGALTKSRDELERKVKERTMALETANDRLTVSNAELERFAFVASHDLQEPLRMISLYLQMLKRGTLEKLNDDEKQYVAFVMDGANRMRALVDDLLTYARLGRGEQPFDEVNLETVVKDVLATLIDPRDQETKVTTEGLPTIRAAAEQMRQLFQNLIGNALKYRGEAPPRVHLKAEKLAGEWRFSVRDNGIGIRPEYFEKIFIVFQRLHGDREKYPGTGIGLAICKRIVERHGGKIWVESVPEVGSIFYFTLPRR